MIFSLLKNRANCRVIDEVHGKIVAAARQPEFYSDYEVADTFEGRFEMLALHAFLVLRRLRQLEAPGPEIAQDLVDAVFAHLDAALRELGVGDVAVPKRMKRLAEAFFGRAAAYDVALGAQDDGPLTHSLGRNVFGRPEIAAHLAAAGRLARYVRRGAATLNAATVDDFAAGSVCFPDPAVTR